MKGYRTIKVNDILSKLPTPTQNTAHRILSLKSDDIILHRSFAWIACVSKSPNREQLLHYLLPSCLDISGVILFLIFKNSKMSEPKQLYWHKATNLGLVLITKSMKKLRSKMRNHDIFMVSPKSYFRGKIKVCARGKRSGYYTVFSSHWKKIKQNEVHQGIFKTEKMDLQISSYMQSEII